MKKHYREELGQLRETVLRMGGLVEQMTHRAIQALVERKIEILDRYQAGRLSVDYKITDQQVSVFRKRLIYAIRVDDAMWVVQYLTERDDFKDALPIFELSIQTFVVQPK